MTKPKFGPPSAQFVTRPVFLRCTLSVSPPRTRSMTILTVSLRDAVHVTLSLFQPPIISAFLLLTRALEATSNDPCRAAANVPGSAAAATAGAVASEAEATKAEKTT